MQHLRSAAFSTYLVLVTLALSAAFLPTLIMPRKYAARAVRIWARAVLGGLHAICGLRYELRHAEKLPKGGALIAANHQSAWETFAVAALFEDPAIILKKELMRIPIYGWWAAKLRMIPIDRAAAGGALKEMARAAERALAEGRQVVIFPEGTRTPPGRRRPYKPGVAALYKMLDAPVVPLAHNSGVFWRHPGILKRPGAITLEILPAIPPGLDKRAFLEALSSAIDGAAERLAAEASQAATANADETKESDNGAA